LSASSQEGGLRKPKLERKLPQLLPELELNKFFRVLQPCGDPQHEIILKRLFYTAVWVSKLVPIKVTDIDFNPCKIFIAEGKGRRRSLHFVPGKFSSGIAQSFAGEWKELSSV
jgi:site-specific recombinase XerD